MSWSGEFIKKANLTFVIIALLAGAITLVLTDKIIFAIIALCVAYLFSVWITDYRDKRKKIKNELAYQKYQNADRKRNIELFYFGLSQRDKDFLLKIYNDKSSIPNDTHLDVRVLNAKKYDLSSIISLCDRVRYFITDRQYIPCLRFETKSSDNIVVSFDPVIMDLLSQK